MNRHRYLFAGLAIACFSGAASAAGDIHTTGSFISDVPSGTPPLTVNSTDMVPNLNADMLDGAHSAAFALKADIPDDGVWEINQDCAVNSGCFPGDSAGFPVSLGASAYSSATSFRLTSNLDVSGESTPEDVSAITMTNVPGVVIDLNGFSIRGPNNCTGTSGSALSCTHQSSATNDGAGIFGGTGFTVRNGGIVGMGGVGIFCNTNCTLVDVRIHYSGRNGADLGSNSHAYRSNFYRNAGDGLTMTDSGTAAFVTSEDNGGNGIGAQRTCVIKASTVQDNGGVGIVGLAGTLVTESTARFNGSHGIDLTEAYALSNSLLGNGGHGLNLDSQSVARSNALFTDTLNGGNQMGDNWCGTVLC